MKPEALPHNARRNPNLTLLFPRQKKSHETMVKDPKSI